MFSGWWFSWWSKPCTSLDLSSHGPPWVEPCAPRSVLPYNQQKGVSCCQIFSPPRHVGTWMWYSWLRIFHYDNINSCNARTIKIQFCAYIFMWYLFVFCIFAKTDGNSWHATTSCHQFTVKKVLFVCFKPVVSIHAVRISRKISQKL